MVEAAQEGTLEVVAGSSEPGSLFHVHPTGTTVAGRDPRNDLVLSDPTVSRRHVEFRWIGAGLWIEDLHSSGGTVLNGRRLTSPQRLRAGDDIQLGAVRLRYQGAGAEAATQLFAGEPHPSTLPTGVQIDNQAGHIINNVDGNQYFNYIQQQREPFLSQVAATKTKARWFTWLGAVVLVVGLAAFARMVLVVMQAIWESLTGGFNGQFVPPNFHGIFDEKVFGLSYGLLGFAVGTLGEVMVVVGIVLHITATARRSRVDKELPLPRTPIR